MWLKLAVEKEQGNVHKEQSKVLAHKTAAEEDGRLAAADAALLRDRAVQAQTAAQRASREAGEARKRGATERKLLAIELATHEGGWRSATRLAAGASRLTLVLRGVLTSSLAEAEAEAALGVQETERRAQGRMREAVARWGVERRSIAAEVALQEGQLDWLRFSLRQATADSRALVLLHSTKQSQLQARLDWQAALHTCLHVELGHADREISEVMREAALGEVKEEGRQAGLRAEVEAARREADEAIASLQRAEAEVEEHKAAAQAAAEAAARAAAEAAAEAEAETRVEQRHETEHRRMVAAVAAAETEASETRRALTVAAQTQRSLLGRLLLEGEQQRAKSTARVEEVEERARVAAGAIAPLRVAAAAHKAELEQAHEAVRRSDGLATAATAAAAAAAAEMEAAKGHMEEEVAARGQELQGIHMAAEARINELTSHLAAAGVMAAEQVAQLGLAAAKTEADAQRWKEVTLVHLPLLAAELHTIEEIEAGRDARQAEAAQAGVAALLASQARADELAAEVEAQQRLVAEEAKARQAAEVGWKKAEQARKVAERREASAAAGRLEVERGVTADVEALRRWLEVEAAGRQGERERDSASERAQLQQLLGVQEELKVGQAERQRLEEGLAAQQRAEAMASEGASSFAERLAVAEAEAATAVAEAAAAAAELVSTRTSASAERERAAAEVQELSETGEAAQRAAEGMMAENGALLARLQEAEGREAQAAEAARESEEEVSATKREVERLSREARDALEALSRAGPRATAAELVAQIAISEISEVEDARAAVAVREANEAAAAAEALQAASAAVHVEAAARAEAEAATAREVEVREAAEAQVAALVEEAEAGRAARALRSAEGVMVTLAATQTDWLGYGEEEEEARLRDPLLETDAAASGGEVTMGEAQLSALVGELYTQLLMRGPASTSASTSASASASASAAELPPLSLHVQQDFLRRYSLKRRADEQLHLLIISVRSHAASNSKVALFGRFTGLASPLPHAAFLSYLRLLSGVEAELGRSLGAEWIGSRAQPLLLLLDQAQQILSSAFRGVLPDDALSRLAHDLTLLARHPAEAATPGAAHVELDEMLMLGVDTFIAEHQRTNAFLEVPPRPYPTPLPHALPHAPPPLGAPPPPPRSAPPYPTTVPTSPTAGRLCVRRHERRRPAEFRRVRPAAPPPRASPLALALRCYLRRGPARLGAGRRRLASRLRTGGCLARPRLGAPTARCGCGGGASRLGAAASDGAVGWHRPEARGDARGAARSAGCTRAAPRLLPRATRQRRAWRGGWAVGGVPGDRNRDRAARGGIGCR